jgi:hypothetical protein
LLCFFVVCFFAAFPRTKFERGICLFAFMRSCYTGMPFLA